MKTVKLLTRHFGENFTTPHTPCGILLSIEGNIATYLDIDGSEKTADMSKLRDVCVAYDNDMIVKTNEFATGEVELPDWLDPVEWLRDMIPFKYLWGLGGKELPELWQRNMLTYSFSSEEKYVYCKLLSQKDFRSEFRKSLRDQIVAWFETPAGNRKYGRPLSKKQWESLATVYDLREASRIANNLYSTRGYY